MDLAAPYLSDQLIAYIGNKRSLLPFLHGVFAGLPLEPDRCLFLDPFAGSGAVSRLARAMGFRVGANDWEPYSFIVNSCHLRLVPSDAARIAPLIDELNALPQPDEAHRYISRHYAPRDTSRADWRTERLFYTRENALRIDAIRQRIEELYPRVAVEGPKAAADPAFLRKATLLAPLLYEAATHTNTSGVFKAYHKGFGGHGRDALTRITGAITLRPPVVIDAPFPAEVRCEDAASFLSSRPADLCYLDPPYSVHQYGSNYFMLNTIALWDRPAVCDERLPDGRLRRKAGIRPDWVRTRSAFCYRQSAPAAMKELLRAADCRWLVMSYSDEGLIGLEELCDMLGETGELSVLSHGYGKYPGGKQSLHRTTRNIELALVVRRGSTVRASRQVRAALLDLRISRLLTLSFDPSRIRRTFRIHGDDIKVGCIPQTLLPMRHFWRFDPACRPPSFASRQEAEAFALALDSCALADVREEIDVLAGIARTLDDGPERRRLLRESLRLLNKLAHRKYRAEFASALRRLRALRGGPDFVARLDAIADRADTRQLAGS